MKKAFLIPGFKQDAREYTDLIKGLEQEGYTPISLKINWKTDDFNDYISQIKSQLKHYGSTGSDKLIGFSWGANIALHVGFKGEKILCSPSDIYSGNEGIKNWLTAIAKKMKPEESPRTLNYSKSEKRGFNPNGNDNVQIIVGDQEQQMYKDFANELSDRLHLKEKGREIVYALGAKHNIVSPEYTNTVLKVVPETRTKASPLETKVHQSATPKPLSTIIGILGSFLLLSSFIFKFTNITGNVITNTFKTTTSLFSIILALIGILLLTYSIYYRKR